MLVEIRTRSGDQLDKIVDDVPLDFRETHLHDGGQQCDGVRDISGRDGTSTLFDEGPSVSVRMRDAGILRTLQRRCVGSHSRTCCPDVRCLQSQPHDISPPHIDHNSAFEVETVQE